MNELVPHKLDLRGCALIIASLLDEKDTGLAIANRLCRATGPGEV